MSLAYDYSEKKIKDYLKMRQTYQTKGERLSMSELYATSRATKGIAKRYTQRQPQASRYAKEMVKKHGYKAPKYYAAPKYKEMAARTGRTGREAFRIHPSSVNTAILNSRYTKAKKERASASKIKSLRRVGYVSRTDPYNLRPDIAIPRAQISSYTTDILHFKKENRPLRTNEAVGTIAKNPKVRKSANRLSVRANDHYKKFKNSGWKAKYRELNRETARKKSLDYYHKNKEKLRDRKILLKHPVKLVTPRGKIYTGKGYGGGGAGPGALMVRGPKDLIGTRRRK